MARPDTDTAGAQRRAGARPAEGGDGRGAADRPHWWFDALVLAFGAIAIRLPALFASRALTFDEGVYGSAVLAMRDGAQPFRDVFSSQGPLQLPLLWLADLVGFRTLDAPRLLSIASGAVVTVAVYAIARRVATRGGALLAAALVATSGSMLWVTAPISGDGPALAFGVTAVALAFAYRARPSTGRAILVGLAMGGALSIKVLVIPVAIPVGLLLLRGGRARAVATAVGAAIAVYLASALPWGISAVWDQSVAFHQNATRTDSYGGNFWRLVRTLCERDILLTVVAVAALVSWLVARRVRRSPGSGPPGVGSAAPVGVATRTRVLTFLERPAGMFSAWLVLQSALLVWEPQMWRPHVSEVIAPLALLVALRPPPWRLTAVLLVAAMPWYLVNVHPMLWPTSYAPNEANAVARIRALPPGAFTISDEPTFIWRADRRTPGDLVDSSIKRIQEKMVTAGSVARAAAAPDVCAVVVWTSRFGNFTSLPDRLAAEGYRVARTYGGPRVFYEKPDCKP